MQVRDENLVTAIVSILLEKPLLGALIEQLGNHLGDYLGDHLRDQLEDQLEDGIDLECFDREFDRESGDRSLFTAVVCFVSFAARWMSCNPDVPDNLLASLPEPSKAQFSLNYSALLQSSAQVQALVLAELDDRPRTLLPGYAIKILTHACLERVQGSVAVRGEGRGLARSLFVFDPALKLIMGHFPPPQDPHSSQTPFKAAMQMVKSQEIWILHCHDWTVDWLWEIVQRQAYFVLALESDLPSDLPWQVLETLREVSNLSRDKFLEQRVQLRTQGGSFVARRVVLQLHQPMGNQAQEVVALTNLPVTIAYAQQVIQLSQYRGHFPRLFHQFNELFQPLDLSVQSVYLGLILIACNLLVAFMAVVRSGVYASNCKTYEISYLALAQAIETYYETEAFIEAFTEACSPDPLVFDRDEAVRDMVVRDIAVHGGRGERSRWQTMSFPETLLALRQWGSRWVDLQPGNMQVPVRDFRSRNFDSSLTGKGGRTGDIPDWIFQQVNTDLAALNSILIWFDQVDRACPSQTIWLQCKIALAEGFTNAVRWAQKGLPPETPVQLEVSVIENGLEIQIWDQGKPFDLWGYIVQSRFNLVELLKVWDTVPTRLRGLENLRHNLVATLLKRFLPEDGRGIPLMLEIADYLNYTRTANQQNCLLLVKYFGVGN